MIFFHKFELLVKIIAQLVLRTVKLTLGGVRALPFLYFTVITLFVIVKNVSPVPSISVKIDSISP